MNYPSAEVFEEKNWNENVNIDKIYFYDDGNLN